MRKNILFVVFAFIANLAFSQVDGVNYKLKFNNETCLFDCYLVINKGETLTLRDRVQLNAQVSIVTPANSSVYVEESYMPLKSNQMFNSTDPTSWEISSLIESPNDLPESNIIGITPYLIPSSFHNLMAEGDEVKLFSLKVSPLGNCGQDVRIYDNTIDPKSNAAGMLGNDFSNGFTIGSVQQKFEGISPMEYPENPTINSIKVLNTDKLMLDVDAVAGNGSCQRSLSYEFYGPNGLIGDYADLNKLTANDVKAGAYKVIVTDNIGCSTEASFTPKTSTSLNGLGLTAHNELDNKTSEVRSFDGQFAASVFPNPAQNDFTITLNGAIGTDVNVDIVDVKGAVAMSNVVKTKMASENEEITISTDLNPGIYTVAVTINNDEIVNHKLIIIK